MSWDLRFDEATRTAVLRARGAVNVAASLAAVEELVADPRLTPGHAILLDLRSVDYTPTLADARQLTDLDGRAERIRAFPLAFVTATPQHFSAAALLSALANAKGAVTRAFRSFDEAAAWLDARRAATG